MPREFDAKAVDWLDETKYMRIRAGATHRFINIWIVVLGGRVFARSWNNKPSGWFAAFLQQPEGAIEIDDKSVPVMARIIKDEKTLEAVTAAFGAKYKRSQTGSTSSVSPRKADARTQSNSCRRRNR